MAYCRNCGEELTEQSRFCHKCGSLVNGGEEENGAKQSVNPKGDKKDNLLKVVLIAVSAVCIILIIVVVLLFVNANKNDNKYSENAEIEESSVLAEKQAADNWGEGEAKIETSDVEETEVNESDAAQSVTVNRENVVDYYGLWINNQGMTLQIGTDIWTTEEDTAFYLVETDYNGYIANDAGYTVNNADINGDSYHIQYEAWGTYYDIMLEFTEDGIYVEGQNGSWPERSLFTLRGAQKQEGSAESAYSDSVEICVNDQYSDGSNTYLVVNNLAAWEPTWIICLEGQYLESYIDCYIIGSDITFCPDLFIKGYPVCMVDFSEVDIWDSDTYWNSVGGDYEEEYEYADDSTWDDYGDYSDDNYTDEWELVPPADFTKEYDACFYDENTGLWVFAYTTSNKRPFKVTGIDLLTWTTGKIGMIARVQNTDVIDYYYVSMDVMLCGENGNVLRSNDTEVLYYPNGYEIYDYREIALYGEYTGEMEEWYSYAYAKDVYGNSIARVEQATDNASYTIPAGEEGVLMMEDYGYITTDIKDISSSIKYIYIVLDEYR